MHHEVKFRFGNGNGNDTAVIEFDGNAVRMSNDLAILIYNSIINTVVEDSVKTIEKNPLTEFIHLMYDSKIIVKLKRKEDGDITEASIIIDELTEEDKKLMQGGEE